MTRKSVLVVEDDQDIAEVLVYNLTEAGYKVRAVTKAGKGLDKWGQPPQMHERELGKADQWRA